MNPRFPVLSTLSILLKIVGFLIVAGAILFTIYEVIIEPNQPRHGFGAEEYFQLALGISFSLIGLFTIAFSEVIGVLFAIESNTRNLYELQKSRYEK